MDPQSVYLPDAAPSATLPEALRARVADAGEHVFLRFDESRWTFAETYRQACRFANLFLQVRDGSRPFHVGVLMDNRPEFVFAQFGCGLAGAVVVGLNPTRTGAFLARDLAHADCQIVVVERAYAEQLRTALRDSAPPLHVFVADVLSPAEASDAPRWTALDAALRAVPDDDPQAPVQASDVLMIIFTSGTTKAPKGVLNSHGRLMLLGWATATYLCRFTRADTVYASMPLFHTNGQILALLPALAAGGCVALARRFSKMNFLPDVRRYHATLFNYVGNPLAYIMDTPERPDDADNPLRLAYGNEAPRQCIDAFARRFGCEVIDAYGSSEAGVGFTRAPGDPPRSLGRAAGVRIINERGEECPPARFDAAGRLVNPDEAVGEIVNTTGTFLFEGYYKDADSTRQRSRHGWFYTGDLGYADSEGFIYFAGRDVEWLRVGGENFLARPIEEALVRHSDIVLASVYGVPDADAGDQVMAAITLRSGASFDAAGFAEFVDGAAGLPQRWRPVFVRVMPELTSTGTNKVLKRLLRREKFLLDRCGDAIYWRPRGASGFRRLMPDDVAALRGRFERAGNSRRLDE